MWIAVQFLDRPTNEFFYYYNDVFADTLPWLACASWVAGYIVGLFAMNPRRSLNPIKPSDDADGRFDELGR